MVKKLRRLYVKVSPFAVLVRRKKAALYSNSSEPQLVDGICCESTQSDLFLCPICDSFSIIDPNQINMHTKRSK